MVCPGSVADAQPPTQDPRRRCCRALCQIYDTWSRVVDEPPLSYSPERLGAYAAFCATTSGWKVAWLTFGTPMPALLFVLGLNAIPLASPTEGWRAQQGCYVRTFVMMAIVLLTLDQTRRFYLPRLKLGHTTVVVFALCMTAI